MRLLFAALGAAAIIGGHAVAAEITVESFPIAGNRPHDVAPAPDGGVWYTAQRSGFLGKLDPKTGEVVQITLGRGSAPHGVIVGPEGNAWITDGGQNAIVKVDARSHDVTVFPLPASAPSANLNTAAFDGNGVLWWTGQSGYYGRLDPVTGTVEAWRAPRGRGPYGITATPDGQIYYASLAGSYIAKVDILTGEATVIEPPTPNQGARRVWSDSKGNIWVSEWNAGQVARLRAGDRRMDGVAAPRRAPASLRGVRGRAGHRLAHRFRRQRGGAIRSLDRGVYAVPRDSRRCPGAPAPGPRR